jgi:hypothetical protein
MQTGISLVIIQGVIILMGLSASPHSVCNLGPRRTVGVLPACTRVRAIAITSDTTHEAVIQLACIHFARTHTYGSSQFDAEIRDQTHVGSNTAPATAATPCSHDEMHNSSQMLSAEALHKKHLCIAHPSCSHGDIRHDCTSVHSTST